MFVRCAAADVTDLANNGGAACRTVPPPPPPPPAGAGFNTTLAASRCSGLVHIYQAFNTTGGISDSSVSPPPMMARRHQHRRSLSQAGGGATQGLNDVGPLWDGYASSYPWQAAYLYGNYQLARCAVPPRTTLAFAPPLCIPYYPACAPPPAPPR